MRLLTPPPVGATQEASGAAEKDFGCVLTPQTLPVKVKVTNDEDVYCTASFTAWFDTLGPNKDEARERVQSVTIPKTDFTVIGRLKLLQLFRIRTLEDIAPGFLS